MKDYLRDYATAAFRFYARNGKSDEAYKEKIYNQALEEYCKREKGGGIGSPTEAMIIAAENKLKEMSAEIADMEAVQKTMMELSSKYRPYPYGLIKQAVEIVYFKDADKELQKGDIQDRVHIAELSIPASERSVYYYLKKARELFAEYRGLRMKKYYKSLQ